MSTRWAPLCSACFWNGVPPVSLSRTDGFLCSLRTAVSYGKTDYPPEFRRKVLDLVAAGRSIADVAHDLEISEQTIHTRRRQDRIDRGEIAGLLGLQSRDDFRGTFCEWNVDHSSVCLPSVRLGH